MIFGRKIDLRRRGQVIVTSTGPTTSTGILTEWVEEEFEVTSTVITNRTITLANDPILGSEVVKLNGLVLVNNINWDYTILDKVITFTNNLELTDDPNHPMTDYIAVKYEKLI